MHRQLRQAGLVLITIVATNVIVADEPETANIYLITNSIVQIEAEPDAIWPFILDTSDWKTLAESSHHAGEPDQLGEIEIVRGGSGANAYEFFVETITLIPGKRKVIAIYFDKGATGDVSYAAWTLFPNDAGTMVTYDVYSINRLPDVPDNQIAAVREQVTAPNRTRFQKELLVLKGLVEDTK